jgi:hypothetical protein
LDNSNEDRIDSSFRVTQQVCVANRILFLGASPGRSVEGRYGPTLQKIAPNTVIHRRNTKMATNYLNPQTTPDRHAIDWFHWASIVTLALGALVLASRVLTLGAPGTYIEIFLFSAFWSSIALALSRQRLVTILALFLVLLSLQLAREDYKLGRVHQMRRFTELEQAPTSRPTTVPAD